MRGLLGIGRGDPRQPDSDTSALDVRAGQDIQGIPWSSLHFSRESYRETRILQYANYENVTQTSAYLRDSLAELHKVGKTNDIKGGKVGVIEGERGGNKGEGEGGDNRSEENRKKIDLESGVESAE